MQNNLKTLRQAAGFTQQKMATDLGVALSTVQNWESDRTEMTGYSLIMVADYLRVPPKAIYGTDKAESIIQTDENSLLLTFRKCSKEGKDRVLEYAEMIAREFPKGTEDD